MCFLELGDGAKPLQSALVSVVMAVCVNRTRNDGEILSFGSADLKFKSGGAKKVFPVAKTPHLGQQRQRWH